MADIEVGIRDGRRTWVAPIEWFPHPDGLERATVFQPGFNSKPTVDPRKDYGVSGMEITWYLRGPKGAIQFQLYTDWTPGRVYPGHGLMPDLSCGHYRKSLDGEWESMYPMGAELGYHARNPQFPDQGPLTDECRILGGTCYYDGSVMAAHDLAKRFVVHGEPVIWAVLEDRYRELDQEGEG